VNKLRSHSVRDMDFRSVPEVQLSYRFITDWEFAATAKPLDFSTFENLEVCVVLKYKERLSVVCVWFFVFCVLSLAGGERESSLWRLPFGECYRFGIF
jgi:hypothetical protein